MSIAIIANVVLAAAVGTTVVALLSWSIVTKGRRTRVAGNAGKLKLPLLAVVSAGCLAALASSAAATGTGAITGTVTNTAAAPAPLASMCVAALNASTGSQVGFTTTNSSGKYTISGLPTGSYKVKFTDCSGVGYVPQYYNNKPSFATATSVALAAPATVTGINAKMVLGAKITGTVTNNAASPTALAKMCVLAVPASGGPVTSSAITSASGQYTIRALPTGAYKIEFEDCAGTNYVTQYYSNHPSFSTANSVSVTAPAVTSGINAKMVLGGKITGTVTNNAASPAPLANMCVSVLTSSGTFVNGVTTPANGQYSIAGVPAGSKKVLFSSCGSGDYVPQYYNNKPSLATANAVSVAAGATNTAINAKMVPAGKISGTVTNNAAAPLAHVCVDALDTVGTVIENATTNAKGQYTIGSLPAGSYKVQFIDCGQQGYISQYYKNQATFAAANPLSVKSAVTITGITAKLVHS
jgi:hypothetical protein